MESAVAGFLIIVSLCGLPVGYSGSAEARGIKPFYITEGFRSSSSELSNLIMDMTQDPLINVRVHEVSPEGLEYHCANGV